MQITNHNQHWLSQFMLRGFHAGSPAQIWAFDKLTGRSFTTAISTVASEAGFYNIGNSAELDDMIGRFEAASAPIVDEIRTRKNLRELDGDQRLWLSGFTALQLVRTKAYSERSQDMMRQITEAVTKMSGGKLSRQIRKQLGLDTPGSAHEKTLSTIRGLVRAGVEELMKKDLVLFRSNGSTLFWIGDSPVALHNSINPGDHLRSTLGLGVQGIEVYLPVSKDLVLAHMCPSVARVCVGLDAEAHSMGFIHAYARPYLQALQNGCAMPISEQQIRSNNRLQLAFAERFVYASEDDFEDARRNMKENPSLKTGPRYGTLGNPHSR